MMGRVYGDRLNSSLNNLMWCYQFVINLVYCIHQAPFLLVDKVTRLGDMGSFSANTQRHDLQLNIC